MPPSRDKIIAVKDSFQGLLLYSPKYSPTYGGPLPWFTAALPAMNAAGELNNTLGQIKLAGDTHCQVDLKFNYGEDGQPWGTPQLVPDCDLSGDMTTYRRIFDKVVNVGLIPIAVLPAEGQIGIQWLNDNLVSWVAAMRIGYDRLKYCLIQLGYDGTWPYSWSVQQVKDVLTFVRSVIGQDACLGMMFGNGPAGNPYLFVEDEGDYSKPWMQCLDVIMVTTNPDQALCPALVNTAQYMLGPALKPQGACTPQWQGPYLLSPGTPRGPYGWCWREWREYQFVRDPSLSEAIRAQQAQMESLGIISHG